MLTFESQGKGYMGIFVLFFLSMKTKIKNNKEIFKTKTSKNLKIMKRKYPTLSHFPF